jgi:hypothetical protein
MGRICSTNGEKRNAYKLMVGKPEGKRLLGRPRQMDGSWRGGMGQYGLEWSGSGQEQMERSCGFGNEPLGSIKYWETIKWANI